MRFRPTADDVLLIAAVLGLLYFRNRWAALAFLALLVYRYVQAKKKEQKTGQNEFLIDSDDMSHASAELDVDIRYRPAPNHFRIDEHFDTRYSDSEYEFRIDALKTVDITEKWTRGKSKYSKTSPRTVSRT